MRLSETHACGFCRGSGRLPLRPIAAVLVRACKELAARGKPITTIAVREVVEWRVLPSTVSHGLARLESQGVLRRTRRTQNGKGRMCTYELVETSL